MNIFKKVKPYITFSRKKQ